MSGEQLNVEWLFRQLYNLFRLLVGGGDVSGGLDFSTFVAFWEKLWFWVVVLGYGLTVIGFFVIIYASMRLFELRKREHEYYSTLIVGPESQGDSSPRWQHIQSLLDEDGASAWREAITEADIMLDDVLKKHGYAGDGVAERLRSVDAEDVASLQDAWEAHKVRNKIAHEGSAFALSQELAQRTLARYESVFREFGAI